MLAGGETKILCKNLKIPEVKVLRRQAVVGALRRSSAPVFRQDHHRRRHSTWQFPRSVVVSCRPRHGPSAVENPTPPHHSADHEPPLPGADDRGVLYSRPDVEPSGSEKCADNRSNAPADFKG